MFINIKNVKYTKTSNDLSGFIEKIEESKKNPRVKIKKKLVRLSSNLKLNLNLCLSKKNNENNPTKRVTPK